MDENTVQSTSEQETIPVETDTQEEVTSEADIETAPQDNNQPEDISATADDGGNGSEENGAEPETAFLEVRYNHEKRNLSRAEAVTLAQKGIHFQSTYDTLERVATLRGKSVKELLTDLETEQDNAYRKGLEEKFGDDEDTIGKMMELYNINKQKTLDNAKASQRAAAEQEEQTLVSRLAKEFDEMKSGDFPELTEYKDLPESVKVAAANGLSLSHAYLKYMHNENKKIAAAKASQEEAAKKSTGSMAGGKEESTSLSALLSGLWH